MCQLGEVLRVPPAECLVFGSGQFQSGCRRSCGYGNGPFPRCRGQHSVDISHVEVFALPRSAARRVTRRAFQATGLSMSAASLCHPALLGCVSPFPQPAAPKLTVRLAVPSGGAAALINELVGTAVDRALPAVNGAAGVRYAVEVIDVPQPAPAPGQTAPPLSSTLGPLLASAAPPDLLLFTQVVNVGVVPSQFALYATITGGLHSLDEHLRGRRDLPLNEFHAPALDVRRNRGKLLGVPLMAVPLLLTYDARRFEVAGWLAGGASPTPLVGSHATRTAMERSTITASGQGFPLRPSPPLFGRTAATS
jgi:hypothetical protein